jgi:translation initiation factor 2D
MFHKEGSIHGSDGGKKKAIDVPLKQSFRRQLRQRATSYFWNDLPNNNNNENNESNNDDDTTQQQQQQQQLSLALDEIFLKGNLSSRSLPYPGINNKAWQIILYLKTPTTNDDDSDTNQYWPYKTSSNFVWMALEEKKNVIHETPTIALWGAVCGLIKDMSAYSVVIPSAASKNLCRGADLMRAGIIQVPSSAVQVEESAAVILNKASQKKKNQQQATTTSNMVAVCVRGNPQPFAVGICKITKSTLDQDPRELFGPSTKGIGVEIWNCLGDDLWRFSNTKEQIRKNCHDDGSYGNPGFVDGKYVLPLVPNDDADADDDGGGDDGEEDNNPAADEDVPSNNETKEATADDSPSEDTVEPQPDSDAQPHEETTLSADDVLHHAFCQALVNLKSKDLPMSTGTFYAQHVLPNRPEGTTINLKETTYKKFGGYLKEQMDNGLVQVGPDTTNKNNKDPVAMLISYNKKHDDMKGFRKTANAAGDGGDGQHKKLVLVTLYVIPAHWSSHLRLDDDDVKATNASSEDRKGTGMLTSKEVREVLDKYIDREELAKNAPPGSVNLDGPLTDALFGNKKQQNDTPDRITRKDLAKLWTAKHSPAYAFVEMPGSKIVELKKGNPPKVEIEVSRRQSNKFVTRVRGLEHYAIDPSYFSKDVSRRLAISSSIDDDPTTSGRAAIRKGHVEIVFGANIVDELEALLTGDESLSSHGGVKDSEYGIPKNVIEVSLRKGVPARKRAAGGNKKK